MHPFGGLACGPRGGGSVGGGLSGAGRGTGGGVAAEGVSSLADPSLWEPFYCEDGFLTSGRISYGECVKNFGFSLAEQKCSLHYLEVDALPGSPQGIASIGRSSHRGLVKKGVLFFSDLNHLDSADTSRSLLERSDFFVLKIEHVFDDLPYSAVYWEAEEEQDGGR